MNIKQELGRKLVHLSSLWMVAAIYVLNKPDAMILFSALFCAFFVFEYLRMTNAGVAKLTTKIFGKVMRAHEIVDGFRLYALTGSFYFLLAVLLSVVFFTKEIAMASITIMIFSDTMAALIGKCFGTIKIHDKTLEGSAAFFISTCAILYPMISALSYIEIVAISLIVTCVELLSGRIKILNDNLTITLCVGGLLTLLAG